MKLFKQWFDMKIMKKTCGSVHSRLSALARLATAGSEAAETMYLRPSGRGGDREEASATASVKAVGGLDGMTRPTQVNCRKHRQSWRAKDADRLWPKRHAVRWPAFSVQAHGQHDCRCIGRG